MADRNSILLYIKLTILFSYRFLLPVILLVCILFPYDASAQKHEVGFGLGGFNYTGDLARDFAVRHTRPGLGLLYRYNVNNHLSLRGGAARWLDCGQRYPALRCLGYSARHRL